MESTEEFWVDVGYVKCSKYRMYILEYLYGEARSRAQIRDHIGIKIYSEYINQMTEHDLLVCINPELKMDRIYKLSDKGEYMAKLLFRK